MRQKGGTYWRVPGRKPATQISQELETKKQNQAGKQREDLDGNTYHLPREIREGGLIWTSEVRPSEAWEDRSPDTLLSRVNNHRPEKLRSHPPTPPQNVIKPVQR